MTTRLLGAIKASKAHQEFFQGSSGAIHPALGQQPDDILVVKHRVSTFCRNGSRHASCERDSYHRAVRLATSGVVLTTLLQANDVDYRLVLMKIVAQIRIWNFIPH